MIPTYLLILAYLLVNQGVTVPDADVRAFVGNPSDFDATLAQLTTEGRVSSPTAGSTTLGPNETEATVNASATSMLAGDALAAWEVWIAGAGSVVVNPFRDDALGAGYSTGDAQFGAAVARLLALRRKLRHGDPSLIAAATRAGAVGDKAAAALA
jgi:hypothetical protein